MRTRIIWGAVVAIVATAGCSKSGDDSKAKGSAASCTAQTPATPPAPAKKEEPPPPPPPPPKPTFDREAVLARIDTALNSCIEFDPAVQFLDDKVVRIQYVHGCGEFEKADAGKVMWTILQECLGLVDAAGVDAPTFKIQAFTRNGASLFTSVTAPKDIARIKSQEMGFDDWVVRIGEGPKKLQPSPSEAAYLKALPEPPADLKVPEGDDVKVDLTAYIEDLECADDVSKLTLGKIVTIGYKEVCGNYEDAIIRLTIYEVALRAMKQFDKHGVWAGLEITARAENGGDVFKQKVPARILQGIKDRQVGIIDWVTRKY